ncbi:MAG: diphthine--ammonia ligase [Thermoflavifilum sp.]|uniref:Dph6-related ATP pyrophosphatase n=1 Tax=Thermoflavifilum sp. TaxID=1968839 RepID=UPI0018A54441|nr:diphthine--ammonia ligase [Thermoflavifilum sp.]QOR75009.1 MAG: diphthine--ammonia ligase [Thermoflavifilum sp.]
MKEKAFLNWSGGKDAMMAYFTLRASQHLHIAFFLTTCNEAYRRISMHGVRETLLDLQAQSLGVPLKKVWLPEQASMDIYNAAMQQALMELQQEGCTTAVFGDIFLEDLRRYREQQLQTIGMKASFPLWKEDTRDLLKRFVDSGFQAIVVCVNGHRLDRSFAGRIIDHRFIEDLPPDVDPCGENGEFHSFVFDGPLFRFPVAFRKGEIIERQFPAAAEGSTGWDTVFWYCDLIPENENGA